jgi:hypothetical protein
MAADWRMTVRAGSKVERDRFKTLDEALIAVAARLSGLRADAPRETVRAFAREYAPVQQVAARVELARGRLGRPRGGVDVRGDGSAEAWIGLVRKRLVEPGGGEDAVSALGRELAATR